uniref:Sm domain-containing protein n=1 Tax=Panagrolaimus sp. JU765 TaxID=591449 RepID=A0AC34RS34_9BILA
MKVCFGFLRLELPKNPKCRFLFKIIEKAVTMDEEDPQNVDECLNGPITQSFDQLDQQNPDNLIDSSQVQGGREVCGTLRCYGTLLNVVLGNCIEFLRDPDDPFRYTGETKALGLIVARGPAIAIVGAASGVEEIENPFNVGEE